MCSSFKKYNRSVLAICVFLICGGAFSGCTHVYLIEGMGGMSTPLMGRGEVSEKKLLPKLEIHAGTTGLINNQTWTKLGVGLGISQRIRFWFGEGTREVGVHLFHLSRKMGRFSVRSRLTTFVGILPHPTRSTVFLLSEQLNVAALWHPSKKKSSFFISFGAFTDITTTSRVGDVIDYGGSVGIGYGLRSEKR